MALNIKQMQAKYSDQYFDFTPETYVLPSELDQFQAAFNKKQKGKNLWIVKPSCSSQGKGIYLIDSLL
jgi:glutathione synthase/RimK-type ligase-like ATP-grasp enzyme